MLAVVLAGIDIIDAGSEPEEVKDPVTIPLDIIDSIFMTILDLDHTDT